MNELCESLESLKVREEIEDEEEYPNKEYRELEKHIEYMSNLWDYDVVDLQFLNSLNITFKHYYNIFKVYKIIDYAIVFNKLQEWLDVYDKCNNYPFTDRQCDLANYYIYLVKTGLDICLRTKHIIDGTEVSDDEEMDDEMDDEEMNDEI